MVIAIDALREWEFIAPSDLEEKDGEPLVAEDDRTVWLLKSLTPARLAEITDMGMQQDTLGGKVTFRAASQIVAILLSGLVGWRNLKDRKGVDVPVPEAPMDRIARIPELVRADIAREIRYNAELTAKEGN